MSLADGPVNRNTHVNVESIEKLISIITALMMQGLDVKIVGLLIMYFVHVFQVAKTWTAIF